MLFEFFVEKCVAADSSFSSKDKEWEVQTDSQGTPFDLGRQAPRHLERMWDLIRF